MENVFDAGTNIEAHMIANLLERHGITAHVLGEHLQSAVGEIGAHGNIRVAVDQSEVIEARRIIHEWEQKHVEPEPDEANEAVVKKTKSLGVFPFILGAIAASAVSNWYFNTSFDEYAIDHNQDGKTDEWHYYNDESLLKVETDRNADGEVDNVYKYSRRNGLETGKFDNDFNGTFEQIVSYRFNQPVFSEVDLSGNRQPDFRYTYVEGVLTRLDIYRPGTRVVQKLSFYEMGNRLTKAHWDSDDDGVLDTLITYGPFQEETSRVPLTND